MIGCVVMMMMRDATIRFVLCFSTLTSHFIDFFGTVLMVLIVLMAMCVVHVLVIVHLARITIRGRMLAISHMMLVMTMRALADPNTVDFAMRRHTLMATSERFIAAPWFHVPFLRVHVARDFV